MTRFDATERPLWSLVGDSYLQLLAPLGEKHVRTLRHLGAPPRRADLDEHGFILTQSMPAVAVHVREGRVEERTTRSLDWQLDVDIHCFSGAIGPGDELSQDQVDGTRALIQRVVESLHMRALPGLDGQGIAIQSVEHIATTERVDWWFVRTDVLVRHEIRRQRTDPVERIEFHQYGQRAGQLPSNEPLATTILDFASASAKTTEESQS